MRAGLQKWTVLTKVIKINSRRQKGKLFLSTDIYTIRKNSAQICDIIRNICLSLFSTDLPAPPSQFTPNTSNSSLSTSLFNTPSALLCSIIIAIKARGKKGVQCAHFNNLGQLMKGCSFSFAWNMSPLVCCPAQTGGLVPPVITVFTLTSNFVQSGAKDDVTSHHPSCHHHQSSLKPHSWTDFFTFCKKLYCSKT